VLIGGEGGSLRKMGRINYCKCEGGSMGRVRTMYRKRKKCVRERKEVSWKKLEF
jgi:hypothetical protein